MKCEHRCLWIVSRLVAFTVRRECHFDARVVLSTQPIVHFHYRAYVTCDNRLFHAGYDNGEDSAERKTSETDSYSNSKTRAPLD